ncbi:MAG: hypothetical protein U1E10_19385 [Bdellovibrionales bacterium]|nr:hypothetical protein [Bdellovibrionales bacterium]
MTLRASVLTFVSFVLVSCSTSYKPEGRTGGYRDLDLGQNRYLVTFRGNGYTRESTVQEFAVRRAKELCGEKGKEAVIQGVDGNSRSSQAGSTFNCTGSNCYEQKGMKVTKHSAQVQVECR